MPRQLKSIDALRHPAGSDPRPVTPADTTDGILDWQKVSALAWRPAWSIRSRRGSVGPFLVLLRGWMKRGDGQER
jgi:hypothetical protein